MPADFRSHLPVFLLACCLLGGCQSAYYSAWEKLGVHKRDILVDRVADARDDQKEAKEQFQSALEQFAAVVKIDGGDLEKKYNKLQSELDSSEAQAEDVRERIRSVEQVADALFVEWEGELGQYSNADLRRASEKQLSDTRQRYGRLLAAMRRAESKMEPVLKVFRDQVLFLKHNLNARAIASLQTTVVQLETDVAGLIREMQASINEADSFLKSMEK